MLKITVELDTNALTQEVTAVVCCRYLARREDGVAVSAKEVAVVPLGRQHYLDRVELLNAVEGAELRSAVTEVLNRAMIKALVVNKERISHITLPG